MVSSEPFASSQQTSLMLTWQKVGEVVKGIGTPVSQIPLLKDEMVECISNGYLPIVIEGDRDIAWIYLNTVDDPRGYEGEDFEIQTNFIELSMDLFPLKIEKRLMRKLRLGHENYKRFFKAIGVEYDEDENGEIISRINYKKFEKFVYSHEQLKKPTSLAGFIFKFI